MRFGWKVLLPIALGNIVIDLDFRLSFSPEELMLASLMGSMNLKDWVKISHRFMKFCTGDESHHCSPS